MFVIADAKSYLAGTILPNENARLLFAAGRFLF